MSNSTINKGKAYKLYEDEKKLIEDAYTAGVDKAAQQREQSVINAENAYRAALGLYGNQAEKLAAQGYSTGAGGGYSSYLASSANKSAMDAKSAAETAYGATVADLTSKKQESLAGINREYEGAKLNAYSQILNNAGTGAYGSVADKDNAISAYKTLYGDMDETDLTAINDAYTKYAASNGETIGADAYNQLTDDSLKGAYKTNYLTKIGTAVPSVVASFVANGETDTEAVTALNTLIGDINKITDTNTKSEYINKVVTSIADAYNNVNADDEASKGNYYKFVAKAMESLDDAGKTALVGAISKNFKNGADFSYLGLSNNNDGQSKFIDYDGDGDYTKVGLIIKGYVGKIKVDNKSTVDNGTAAILDALVSNTVGNISDEDAKRGYAVAYNGKIYFHTPNGWKETKAGRSDGEIDRLKKMGAGDNADHEKMKKLEEILPTLMER